MRQRLSLRRAFRDTLFARIVILLVANVVLIHAVDVLLFSLEDQELVREHRSAWSRAADAYVLLASMKAAERPAAAAALSRRDFVVTLVGQPPAIDSDWWSENLMRRTVTRALPAGMTLPPLRVSQHGPGPRMGGQPPPEDQPDPQAAGTAPPPPDAPAPTARSHRFSFPLAALHSRPFVERLDIAFGLDDGEWLKIRSRTQQRGGWWPPWLTVVLSSTLVIIGLSVFFARSVTRRLRHFSSAAEAFGRSGEAPALAETGPREIAAAAAAFNRMQERLRRFVRDRTEMLAAISHDLRTPLTRLRLRAEFVEDEDQQAKMLADIAEMEAMIAETMAFARDDPARELRELEDLDQLLAELCRLRGESGEQVSYQGPDPDAAPVAIECSRLAMRRAFGNLLDNAVKYGRRAEVRLRVSADTAIVEIADDGPGIPQELREQVFQPFVRLDRSRNRDTGGVGLGMAVARDVMRAHGGDIALGSRPDAAAGLVVTVSLPLALLG